jgi:hypothetical protein
MTPEELGMKEFSPTHFVFESGSYGGRSQYLASIACMKVNADGEAEPYFAVVKPGVLHKDVAAAEKVAEVDLLKAMAEQKRLNSDLAVAEVLTELGYIQLPSFSIAED